MSRTRTHDFETPTPVLLAVRTGSGSVRVDAGATDGRSHVRVTGPDCDEVVVEQHDDRLVVVAPRPRSGFWTGGSDLDVEVSVPPDCSLEVRVGSAEVTVTGRVTTGQVRSGSGGVTLAEATGPLLVETGSGDVSIGCAGDSLRVKSGSGSVRADRCESAVAVSTGSGDVEIRASHGPAAVKTGSGDLRVVEAHADVALNTASGDLVVDTLRRGRLTAKGASGDVEVGIPGGVPVWTDISTVTGRVGSDLASAGEPAPGQDHVEVRATSVSGSISLRQR